MSANPSGRYQIYYERIRAELEQIQFTYSYTNLSKAFGHWHLSKQYGLDEQEIAEALIDGFGDCGIDAIIRTGSEMTLFQYKCPEKVQNITKKIKKTDVLKVVEGYKKLTANRAPKRANDRFLAHRETVRNESIFQYSIVFVSLSTGLCDEATESLEFALEEIEQDTGNTIDYRCENIDKVCGLFERLMRNTSLDIDIPYSSLNFGYSIEGTRSWSGVVNAQSLLEACRDKMSFIFDENIRLFEGDNRVNKGIRSTATGDEGALFYFFHNGVVFICDNFEISTGNKQAQLSGVSIVNGCQTITTLMSCLNEDVLRDDVHIPFRVIETKDIDLRAKVTEYLNSQTEIKESYFLANDTLIRSLQDSFAQHGYFLERLANEYAYRKNLDESLDYSADKVVKLEKAIQLHVAFASNTLASTAKRGKSELFNKNIVEQWIADLKFETYQQAEETYKAIQKVLRVYRKCSRSETIVPDFLHYLGQTYDSEEAYHSLMDSYAFMNTADLLLLNTIANLKHLSVPTEKKLIIAISICHSITSKSKLAPSAATKNAEIFREAQESAENYSPL